jgi:hypothetical protein
VIILVEVQEGKFRFGSVFISEPRTARGSHTHEFHSFFFHEVMISTDRHRSHPWANSSVSGRPFSLSCLSHRPVERNPCHTLVRLLATARSLKTLYEPDGPDSGPNDIGLPARQDCKKVEFPGTGSLGASCSSTAMSPTSTCIPSCLWFRRQLGRAPHCSAVQVRQDAFEVNNI